MLSGFTVASVDVGRSGDKQGTREIHHQYSTRQKPGAELAPADDQTLLSCSTNMSQRVVTLALHGTTGNI